MTEAQPRRRATAGKRGFEARYRAGSRSRQWTQRYVRTADVSFSVVDREAVLYNPRTERNYTLNNVGTVIWEQLDGRPLGAILTFLVQSYDVPEPLLCEDLLALVTQLQAEGLIQARA